MSDLRLVLLGYRRAGKSSTGNTILGEETFGTSVRALQQACAKANGEQGGRHITVVEAPGWFINCPVDQTSEQHKKQIALSVSLCPPGPHALLLVLDVSYPFTEKHRKIMQQHVELVGKNVWGHTILLFTWGEWLGDTSIEQHIESGGEALHWLVQKCGNRYHVVENSSKDGGQVTKLLKKIDKMVEKRGSLFTADSKECEIDLTEQKLVVQSMEVCHHQSSGYISTAQMEDSDFAEMEAKPYLRGHTTGVIVQQERIMTPEQRKRADTGFKTECEFVDASTISVNYKERIGHGGYGFVFRGSYEGTPAAVKIVPLGDTSIITHEFLIPLRLSHPNIVRIMAVAKTEVEILIANEYIHGANLHQVLYKDTGIELDYEDKLFVALDLAMAVQYIHSKRIIHQDIKPANIMISTDNKKAHLMDWGLANWKETMLMSDGLLKTIKQHGPKEKGTPLYMGPECAAYFEDCSPKSDMWSVGITLLEMFTSSQPWECNTTKEVQRLLKQKQPPHAMEKLQPSANDIVKPLLEYDPLFRMSAKELVARLMTKVDVTKKFGWVW